MLSTSLTRWGLNNRSVHWKIRITNSPYWLLTRYVKRTIGALEAVRAAHRKSLLGKSKVTLLLLAFENKAELLNPLAAEATTAFR